SNDTLGCVYASLGTLEYAGYPVEPFEKKNPSGGISSLYNAPLAIAMSFVIISYVLSKSGIVQALLKVTIPNKPDRTDKPLPDIHDHGSSTNETGHDHGASTSKSDHDYIVTTDSTEKSCGCVPKIFDVSSAPSVYDIFRAAQFFITTALISIPNLSEYYQDLASKLSWLCGLPNSFNLSYLGSVADNGIRIGICQMTKTCKTITGVTYFNIDFCDQDSTTGFYNFARMLSVQPYDLFFLAFIAFLSALALAIGIALLIWLFARYSVCLHNKWKSLKTVAANCLCLVLVVFSLGIITFCGVKVISDLKKNDLEIFKKPDHTFIYGALYTQYKENNIIKDS
ncbi:16342_t:CDS:2, partial [Dentiscutata heterogama]